MRCQSRGKVSIYSLYNLLHETGILNNEPYIYIYTMNYSLFQEVNDISHQKWPWCKWSCETSLIALPIAYQNSKNFQVGRMIILNSHYWNVRTCPWPTQLYHQIQAPSSFGISLRLAHKMPLIGYHSLCDCLLYTHFVCWRCHLTLFPKPMKLYCSTLRMCE